MFVRSTISFVRVGLPRVCNSFCTKTTELSRRVFEKKFGPEADVNQPEIHKAIRWVNTADAEFPYEAKVDGSLWQVRINDFPDEPLYTLCIEKIPRFSFDGFPVCWHRPVSKTS